VQLRVERNPNGHFFFSSDR